ncbi:MAG: peptidylprolyl isomerase [Anaerolineales bacterium]
MTLHKMFLSTLLGITLLAACSLSDLQSAIAPPPTETPTATSTVTPTPIPLAARVNGEGIPLLEFEHEIARFELAQNRLGNDLAALGDYRRLVLQSMIEERVAAQAASAMGRAILDEQVDAVIADSRQARGGDAGFEAWLKENFYTPEEFREAIRRQLLVQSATDAVAGQVPVAAEQVHARHILVGNLELANALREQILAGKNFSELALAFSQDFSTNASGGDLGWFPRGVLNVPEVEEAAFSLTEGQTSPVVQSRLGYHLIQTLEREASRPLSSSSLETLRRRAVEAWLAQQMQTAQVEIFI